MRTTLTVDDDLLQAARKRAAQQHLPLVVVINRALRRGLAEDTAVRVGEATIVYGDPTRKGPDDGALRSWTERLDDQELGRKQ